MPSRADAAPAFVWVAELGDRGSRVELDPDSSHHVARVCRARPGETVTLTDGRGGLAKGRIERLTPRVEVSLANVEHQARQSQAWVLCGPPEGRRADWLIEKLAELGVAVFQAVDCERSRWGTHEARPDRWRKLARAAMEQSRSRFALEVRPPRPLIEAADELPSGASRMFGALEGGTSPGEPTGDIATVVIGPAPGLSEAETASLMGRGFRPIRLAENRLRTETAAVAWACWWARGIADGSRGVS